MFNQDSVRVLHLESTTVCQAHCSQCARENFAWFNGQVKHLTIDKIIEHFTLQQIGQLDKMFMCGNFGDPAAGANTLDIYRWFRTQNKDITLGMNTNGALQNTAWWKQLAEIFCLPQDYVVFSIDGLADTNHIYRRGVDWDKLIENVKSFIANGGSAHWDYLIFDHNKHQVEQAKELAQELGFSWFRTKVSKRGKPLESYSGIDCYALKESSMYLAATGELFPCCFLGNTVFARDRRIDNALHTDNFAGVSNSWTDKPLGPCERVCGIRNSTTPFEKQWTSEIQIKKD